MRALEQGRSSPTVETLGGVAAALTIRVSELIVRAEQIVEAGQLGADYAALCSAVQLWHQSGDDTELSAIAEELAARERAGP